MTTGSKNNQLTRLITIEERRMNIEGGQTRYFKSPSLPPREEEHVLWMTRRREKEGPPLSLSLSLKVGGIRSGALPYYK